MSRADRRERTGSRSDSHVLCPRCGRTWPAETEFCGACGADVDGSTNRENVHVLETMLIGARDATAEVSLGDTTPDGAALPSHIGPKVEDLPSFAENTDEAIDHLTVLRPRKPSAPEPPPSAGSSSDPPTHFLRGFDAHIELPAGSIVDDLYEIDRRLGEGAMGVVYSARHLKLGKRVAIKVIAPQLSQDSQAMARFEREARTVAQLHHPGIVDVIGFGELADGRSYFVMEYLLGESLDGRLERGRVPLGEALDILDQIARALEAAHRQGVVHRDLKPANIFLSQLANEHRAIVSSWTSASPSSRSMQTRASRRPERTS